MRDYLAVLKIVLKNNFRASRNKYIDVSDDLTLRKKKITKIINIFCVTLGFGATFCIIGIIVHVLSLIIAIAGLSTQFLSLLFTAGQLMIIFFGISAVLSNIFFSKDNEYLASLPVKPSTVFAVKMTVIYINELLVSTLLLLPMIIAFISGSIVGGVSIPAHFYLMLPIVFLTEPIVPLVFVALLSFPLIKVIAYFKNRSAVTLIATILLIVVLVVIYMIFIPNIEKFFSFKGQSSLLTPQLTGMVYGIGNAIFFNKAFAAALLGQSFWINILIFIATVAVSIGIILGVASILYQKASSSSGEETRKVANVTISAGVDSRKKALFMREFKLLFRNQSFAVNSVMGSVLTPLLILIMSFTGLNTAVVTGAQSAFATDFGNTGFLLFYCMMIMCGMNYTASFAFTREGNNFYMLRYLPVDFKEIFNAKQNISHIVSLVGLVLVALVTLFAVKISISNAFPMIFVIGIYQYAFNNLCIYRDLRKPNVNWTNAYEAIKKNFYPVIPMFYSMGLGVLFMILNQVITKYSAAVNMPLLVSMFWLVTVVIAAVIIVIVKILIKRHAKEYFDRIAFSA